MSKHRFRYHEKSCFNCRNYTLTSDDTVNGIFYRWICKEQNGNVLALSKDQIFLDAIARSKVCDEWKQSKHQFYGQKGVDNLEFVIDSIKDGGK